MAVEHINAFAYRFCHRLRRSAIFPVLIKHAMQSKEELAEVLYVSRTAVSKWESGRGYPNIDSLKALAAYFGLTVDELLSGGELLTIAEQDTKQTASRLRDVVFGLLDLCVLLFLFLPLFGQETNGVAQSVSLISLTAVLPYLRVAYTVVVGGIAASGIVTLALQHCAHPFWVKIKTAVSLCLNAAGALLFIISRQPYAATVLLVFLTIKAFLLIKRR